jgi:hypothetical protein
MKVTGQCHCGEISYSAEIDPDRVMICHCRDCQRLTGSAFRVTVPVPAGSFELNRGEPRIYYKIADSGSRRGHAFCGTCGTPVFRLPTDNNPNYSLRTGGLDQSADLPAPRRQIWTRRRLPWTCTIDQIAEFDGQG